jgi:RNA polymerase sigma factor for flagellar operon FliA
MSVPYPVAQEDRERLILEYLPKVRWIAAGIRERLPASISEEDLVSTGLIGLINAIDNFDGSRNVALWTYAEHKIRGAILDSVRGLDGIPAHKRKHLRRLQNAIASVEQKAGRSATEEEVAAELEISVPRYREMLSDLQCVTLDSLDDPIGRGDDAGTIARFIADQSAETPAETFERREMKRVLTQGVEALPEIERMILHLYFIEELTLVEVGQVVSLHYSRVSQLKTQALTRLRAYVQHRTGARSHG